jgi:hypothetical protein
MGSAGSIHGKRPEKKELALIQSIIQSEIEQEFKKISLDISIAPSSYFFEKNPLALKKEGLSFPVLMKNDIVVQAQDISDIHIPVYNKNWLYIQPGALCPLDTKANDEIIYHSTD